MTDRGRLLIFAPGEAAPSCRDILAERYDDITTTHEVEAAQRQTAARAVDAVALCNPDDGLAAQLNLAKEFLNRNIDVFILRPTVPAGVRGLGLAARSPDGLFLLHLPSRRLPLRRGLLFKVLDVCFAAAVLLAGLPLWLLIALLIKLEDWGPVLFTQDRVGPGGRRFRFWKFRTMWPDAEAHRERLSRLHEFAGQMFKMKDDPRRTTVGVVLRRFSLDEVPQFLHVLTGRMGVIGPRPPLPSEVEQYAPWQQMRLRGWFGLTGLWQVCGRAEVRDLDDVVLLDALYLYNHSLWLDFRIILRTVRVMLSGRGAY
jgi:lipopolysaccharide/colanic/teichoic acid biosynthesis glycosyltransferase